jgi:predicted hotdog family 3-hydroxylacyl-ACP dehydratase
MQTMFPKTRAAIAALIPHQGDMCLLECVESCDENVIVCTTTTHRLPNHPLQRDGALAAIHLCEYGAQAMAVHGGLMAQANGEIANPGLLVALRDVKLSVPSVDASIEILRVVAKRISANDAAWQYEFSVGGPDAPLASGRAVVMTKTALPYAEGGRL